MYGAPVDPSINNDRSYYSLSLMTACAYYIFLFPYYYSDPGRKSCNNPARSVISCRSVIPWQVHAPFEAGGHFKLPAVCWDTRKSIKTGKYLFVSGQSNFDILRDIRTGKSRMIIPVTIPEGWRMEQTARRYMRELGIDAEKFLSALP